MSTHTDPGIEPGDYNGVLKAEEYMDAKATFVADRTREREDEIRADAGLVADAVARWSDGADGADVVYERALWDLAQRQSTWAMRQIRKMIDTAIAWTAERDAERELEDAKDRGGYAVEIEMSTKPQGPAGP